MLAGSIDTALYRYFVAYYRQNRKQLMRGSDGQVCMVGFSMTGVSQGDVCASLIFDVVYTHLVLKPLLAAHPDVTTLAIHDDTYLCALPEHLPAANTAIISLANALDLEYAPSKEVILQLPHPHRSATLALDSYRNEVDPQTEFRTDALEACQHIGGVPIGSDSAIITACERAAAKYGEHVLKLATAPLNDTYKGILMMFCARPQTMLNHYIRSVRPTLSLNASQLADDNFFTALAKAWRCDTQDLSREDPEHWGSRRQLQLALRDGGGAFAALEHTRPAAFLGSLADTLPSLLLVPGSLAKPMVDLLQNCDKWSHPDSPATLREAAAAWEHLCCLPTFSNMKKNKVNQPIYRLLCTASNISVGSDSDVQTGPTLANLHLTAGRQAQRAFAYVILDDLRTHITADPHLSLHARVRIAAASRKGAGRFMIILPAHHKKELLLTSEQYIDNVHLRFGLKLSRRLHDNDTHCNCGKHPSDFTFVQEFIDHVLSCPCTKGTKKQRHDLLLPILEALFKQLGYEWDTSSDGCGFSDVIQAVPGQGSGRLQGDKKLDAVAHWMADRTKSWGIDVTVYHACAESARKTEAACRTDAHITRQAEKTKMRKYEDACADRGIAHLPAAFNTYGGLGEQFLKKVVDPYYNELRAREKRESGQEWVSLQKREFFFQCVNAAIARGNTMILNTMRQDWRNECRVTERRGRKFSAQPDVADESVLVNLIEGGA